MNEPSKQSLISAGYQMSANKGDAIVSRCASMVLEAYILPFVTTAEVAAATETSTIAKAWNALTFLLLLQESEFATRMGGERKEFDHGRRAEYGLQAIKEECNMWLRKLEQESGKAGKINDVCEVYFKTQIFVG